MEKVINRLINEAVENSDKYTRNGSTWLIFTDKKKWIIELTDTRTLWYNYDFFKSLFNYVCLDVIENQHYITKWVENYVLRDGRKLDLEKRKNKEKVEDTIQNGVKDTAKRSAFLMRFVEDTIQNGVKDTCPIAPTRVFHVEDTIENGVKHTINLDMSLNGIVEDTIQNGVKNTDPSFYENRIGVEDIIQNGVKDTKVGLLMSELWVKDTIQNGVNHTEWNFSDNTSKVEDTIQNGVKGTNALTTQSDLDIEDTIQNGVKETISLNCGFKSVVEDIIERGVKNTTPEYWMPEDRVLDTLKKGDKEMGEEKVKYTQRRIDDRVSQVDYVIENSEEKIIKTKSMDEWVNTEGIVGKVIKGGVKEVK